MPRVASLHIYPIKSCRGIRLDTAQLLAHGLAHDRDWMVVHAGGPFIGTFISQRTHPALACVIPRLIDKCCEVHLDADALRASLTAPISGYPESAAGDKAARILSVCSTPLRLPFTVTTPNTVDLVAGPPAASVAVQVWRDTFQALDAGDDAAQWFSALLACPVRLVRFDPTVTRLASARWTAGVEAPTHFADGFPLLLTNQASLDDLNQKMMRKGAPAIPMDRFRPNVVLTDMDAYEEDHVSTLTFASALEQAPGQEPIEIQLVKPCARCPIPTFDQTTGRANDAWPYEPLDTLTTYRMNSRVDGVTFGVNAIVISGVGRRLHCGMDADAPVDFGN
ncbi:hypothetical protein WM40_24585 [Robbsia andropogonis]|uniref:MOSC domain-containing protein n=1 Tax=Robbsia andropogonis TaxID=28092 RepID=A0A0F5JU97_9BURK|nr:MOSC N-terminal beta barrel domain-containing protein [Robbsia andropogonis]KKB61194.1 hypothetical protein WM40_24585 [Robbsia andropogonis]